MKTFIAHYLNDSKRAVEFTAETVEEAQTIAEEHGLDSPQEVTLMCTAPGDSSVDDVIKTVKDIIDNQDNTVH